MASPTTFTATFLDYAKHSNLRDRGDTQHGTANETSKGRKVSV